MTRIVTDPATGEPRRDADGKIITDPVVKVVVKNNVETARPVLDMSKVVDAEADEIRSMAAQLLAGVSVKAITADLRERDVPTVTGAAWTARTVRGILLRPRNAGLAVYQAREAAKAFTDRGETAPYDAGVVGPGGWKEILPEDTWRAVASLLTDPRRQTSPGNTPRWLGSLIYKCGACADAGTEQTVSIKVGGRAPGREPAYVCRGPVAHLSRTAAPVDEYVTDVIIARLSQPDAAGDFARPSAPGVDRAALTTELTALRARANGLSESFADGSITKAQMRAGSERVNTRIREIETVLATAVTRSPLDGLPLGTDQVRGVWASLPLGTRRALLRELVDVTLLRAGSGRYPDGGYFSGKTVDVTWKQREE